MNSKHRSFVVAGVVYAIVAFAYILTAGRGPASGDWGDFVAAASVLGIPHPTGYAVYTQILGLPILVCPRVAAPAAADCATAAVTALAPLLLGGLAYRLRPAEGSAGAAWGAATFSALFLAFRPATWYEASATEVYGPGLTALLLVFTLLAAAARGRRWRYWYAAAFVTGLTFGVHLTSFTYAVVAVALTALFIKPPAAAAAVGTACFAAGLSACLYIPLRAEAAPPLTWNWGGSNDLYALFVHTTGRQFSYNFRLPTGELVGAALRALGSAVLRNLGALVVLAPVGLVLLWKRARGAAVVSAAVLLINLVFLLAYDIPDLGSYRLPAIAVIFGWAAYATVVLAARLRPRWRLAVGAVALAAVITTAVAEGAKSRRDASFVAYYGEEITKPLGYGAIYVSGTTTSNFIFWVRQFTYGQRPDVEFYNINDDRYDIDKLAALMWRESGYRPVYCDFFFLEQTKPRRAFARRGKPWGFILEITDRETSPRERGPNDDEAFRRAAALIRGAAPAPDRPGNGVDLALSLYQHRGYYHQYRGERKLGRRYLARAVELGPRYALPNVTFAGYLLDEGDLAGARRYARAALECGDAPFLDYVAYATLAMASLREGDGASARAYAARSVALKPHDGKTHKLYAQTLLAAGDEDAALRELTRTLQRGYKDPEAVLMLAGLYRSRGKPERAFAVLAENAHVYDDPRVLNAYALALIEQGRYWEAKGELERAARLAPQSNEIQENLRRLKVMGY